MKAARRRQASRSGAAIRTSVNGDGSGTVAKAAAPISSCTTFEECYAFSPGNQEVALWRPGRPGPYLVDSLTWRETAASGPMPPVQVSSIHYLTDGQTVAFTSPDHRIRLWHLDPLRDPSVPRGHAPFEAWAVAFSPDARTLATSGDDHLIRFWDPHTGAEVAPARGHRSLVTSIAWSPDGTTLASGSMDNDRRLCLWRVATGTRTDLKGHTGYVRAAAFSPDGRMLATGSDDRTIRLWDTSLGSQVCELSGHTEGVGAVAFSPDGRSLATGASPSITTARSGSGALRPPEPSARLMRSCY